MEEIKDALQKVMDEAPEQMRDFLDGAEIRGCRYSPKTTVCLITLKNGFEILGKSHCADADKFDIRIGAEWALRDALDQINVVCAFQNVSRSG